MMIGPSLPLTHFLLVPGSFLGLGTHFPTHSAPIPSVFKALGSLPLSTVLNPVGCIEQHSGKNDPGLKYQTELDFTSNFTGFYFYYAPLESLLISPMVIFLAVKWENYTFPMRLFWRLNNVEKLLV